MSASTPAAPAPEPRDRADSADWAVTAYEQHRRARAMTLDEFKSHLDERHRPPVTPPESG